MFLKLKWLTAKPLSFYQNTTIRIATASFVSGILLKTRGISGIAADVSCQSTKKHEEHFHYVKYY